MAEPQPSDVHEGLPPGSAPTASAEDRKAAAALSALDAKDDEDKKGEVDTNALGEAMKGLTVAEGKAAGAKEKDKDAAKKIVNVKVDAADVTLLVNELELSKAKATELLKSSDGDAVKAMHVYVCRTAE
ncbi:hypothetical protein BCR34DRAFT_595272 [Clohesyomyces aquaticus]|uniref:Nascent polypeptide-associated complex subunit alpha-like UBA domain-containing protein n=1 Tax=Clohesyomyces aquaticus TaxID=1231657 RepID=A0A1Y2ABE4_9PLEO|nr:hypothetical protein BCR34DRAFT_595272 [Clohesyomyces aquaticus]